MSQEFGVIISIAIYMIAMLAIGYVAWKRTQNLSDYMLGGRDLGPVVTALSAGASDMSGWLLMGLPGAMYVSGWSAGWIVVGLCAGAWLNWLYVAPRLRTYTEIANNSITIPDYFENRFKDNSRMLRIVSALVIFVFFTLYTSSGMVSGGELFKTSFNMSYETGIFITVGVVVLYTLFGGFLAVSWTDFVQGTIMFIALVMVPVVALTEVGGISATADTIRSIDPAMLNWFTGTTTIGIISLMAWGLGYFGQPHIIVRFMAIEKVQEVKRARRVGMGWMIFSTAGAMLTGLIGIAYVKNAGATLENPETIFIYLAHVLFHPLITGFLLAAILAAIMSTISSQLLVTASALAEDFYKAFLRRNASDKELVLAGRLSVLGVSLIAMYLALNPNKTILDLVGYAWAGFGAAFGPVVLLSLFWKRMTKWGALAGMVIGSIVVIAWEQMDGTFLGSVKFDDIYEIIPGFIACTIAIVLVSLLTGKPSEEIEKEFDEAAKQAAS
ncbi:sodium/proline symporter PutP [Staphylospora marina]|uniref:sodium/proline symporter PutP n=1 Tax=Staphylospora marina TaxID=2490858 RepID=UPI000F5C04BD|nr:sodium/proline symporter PutP [Staphylospora marina]